MVGGPESQDASGVRGIAATDDLPRHRGVARTQHGGCPAIVAGLDQAPTLR
jgi:hypothetical protein